MNKIEVVKGTERGRRPRPSTAPARLYPGARALGPLRIVTEELHAHGKGTRPYPVRRTYETMDGTIRLYWDRHGVRVSVRGARRLPNREVVAEWRDMGQFFQNLRTAAAWITR